MVWPQMEQGASPSILPGQPGAGQGKRLREGEEVEEAGDTLDQWASLP